MSDYRARILNKLQVAHGVSEDTLVASLAQVVKGESTKEVYDGNGDLVQKQVVKRPGDVARGAILLDQLMGGQLGLAPRVLATGDQRQELYDKFAPPGDLVIMPVVPAVLRKDDEPSTT